MKSEGGLDLRPGGRMIRTLFQSGSMAGLTDGQLLDRFAAGGGVEGGPGAEAAFAALVERHGPAVLGVCRRLLADAHRAEDAFQATFLVLSRRAGTVRDRDALGAWLHRVARRIALRLRIRSDRQRARERPEVPVEGLTMVPADRVEADELRSVIDAEIDRLGRDQRLPVVLCCVQGLSHEEAASRLRLPLGTVKSRLARGRKRLQDRLVSRGFAPAAAGAAVSGLVGAEATATAAVSVPPTLAETTSRLAASLASGGLAVGVVPASVSILIREELRSMFAARLKFVASLLTVGASAALIGLAALARGPDAVKGTPAVAFTAETPGRPAGLPPAAKLSAIGKVVDAAGRPIAGARVILREWSAYRAREDRYRKAEGLFRGAEEIPDTLAETKADADGAFRFSDVAAPGFPEIPGAGKDEFPWDVVALAPGHGLAWVQLTPQRQLTPFTLTLGDEWTLRGRIVEPGGKPVAGARVKVFGVDPLEKRPVDNGLSTTNRLNLIWAGFPLGARADASGRFAIAGLPRDRVIPLVVTGPKHERVFVYAATTDVPQPPSVVPGRGERGGEDAMPVRTGDLTITSRRADRVLTGRVVFEADGKPATGAAISHGWAIPTKADALGRYRIEGLTAGKLELHANAWGSDAAPVDTAIDIPEGTEEVRHDITLPRGLVLTGRVEDGDTGRGVEKVRLWFTPVLEPGRTPSRFGFSAESGPDGRFRLTVPPGRGTLDFRVLPQGFAQPVRRFTDQAADPAFTRAVEGRGGQVLALPSLKLSRGAGVVLRVVDPEGRPVANARIDVRDINLPFDQKPGHSDARGTYTLTGLPPGQPSTIDITAADRPLGATIEVPDAESAGAKPAGRDLEVRLLPLVSLSGRVLDEDGKPIPGATLHLYRNVMYPGQSGRSFGMPVATTSEVPADGSYTFDSLIPGATYNTRVQVEGRPSATSRHVRAKLGEPVRLDDFRLPSADREVKGLVVDPRGRPVAGATVSYQRVDSAQALYAPTGATWFMETGASGRFALNGLPVGPIRLMAYRRPGEPDHAIQGIQYIDVPPDRADDLRIELKDPNERLRGIE